MRKLVVVWSALLVALVGAPLGSLAQPASTPSEPSPSEAAPASPAVPPPAPEPAPEPAPAAPPSAPLSPEPATMALPLASPSPALASPGSPRPEAPATPRPVGRRLDETAAFALSMGSTLGSWTMFYLGVRADMPQVWVSGLIGAVLAPSFGHWYRGKIVTRGLRVRAAGAALTLLAVGRAITCEDGCNGTVSSVMILGGFALYVFGAADDIISAPIEVRKYNQRLEVLGLAPVVSSQSAGVALAGRF